MPHAPRSAPQPELTALFATVQAHFRQVIVPLWQGPGWNADMALPYEALDAQHHPLPVQRYRAMACARQLYLFSSRIGQPGAAERAAALFRSLQKHFHDAEHGGWFYSIDAQGKPLDRTKDLYTHAFIVFACAHYWGKVRDSLVESALNAALAIVSTQFARDDGLYEASLAEDWADLGSGPLQNPQMHLAEAFLQVLPLHLLELSHVLGSVSGALLILLARSLYRRHDAAFRITQEAVTNILRHAQAKNLLIRVQRLPKGLTLLISDDGLGFAPAANPGRGRGAARAG